MYYDVEVITDIDKNNNNITEDKTIICRTYLEIKNIEEELRGTSTVTYEFETTDGDFVTGLEILKCYRKYEFLEEE